MKKRQNKIIKTLSLKHNIPVADIEVIVNSQFLFVRRTIESAEKNNVDTFKVVKLPMFGKFLVKKNVLNWMNKRKNGEE